MIRNLITSALITMGVGVSAPTPILNSLNPNQNQTMQLTNATTWDEPGVDDETYWYTNYQTEISANNNGDNRRIQNAKILKGLDQNLLLFGILESTNDLDNFNGLLDNNQIAKNDYLTDVTTLKINPTSIMQNASIEIPISFNAYIPYKPGSLPKLMVRTNIFIGGTELKTIYDNQYNNYDYYMAPNNTLKAINDVLTIEQRYANIRRYYQATISESEPDNLNNFQFQAINQNIDIGYLANGLDNYIVIITQYAIYRGINNGARIIDNLEDRFSIYSNAAINYYTPLESGDIQYITVNIPDLMFNILTLPFSFISQAFNFTLFPNTPYAINIANLFLALIGLCLFFVIIRLIIKAIK